MNDATPTFFLLLREAQQASDAVDNFDLHSELPESQAQFERLSAEQGAACVALVRYVVDHHEELMSELRKSQ